MAYELSHNNIAVAIIIMSARNSEIITESHLSYLRRVFFRLNVKGPFKPFSDVGLSSSLLWKELPDIIGIEFSTLTFQTAKDAEYDANHKRHSHVRILRRFSH